MNLFYLRCKITLFLVLVVSLPYSGSGVPAARAEGPSPWDDPALQACIGQVLSEFATAADSNNPDAAPHWVDEWGNWRKKGIVAADQPDDWWDRWKGKRYYRICCGWEEPAGGILQARCNCPCDGVAPPPPPAPPEPSPVPPEPPPPSSPPEKAVLPEGIVFYASYHRLTDTDVFDVIIEDAAMSGDGKKLIWAGTTTDTGAPVVYTMDSDGSNVNTIGLPGEYPGTWEVAINGDGSRSFLLAQHGQAIYKVEGGGISKILDVAEQQGIDQCDQIQTTADGAYVYFVASGGSSRGDLWQASHGGGAPNRIIDDTSVRHDSGPGALVHSYDVSDDGGIIAFVLIGYYDGNALTDKYELFVLSGGGIAQLTNDATNVGKGHVAISGDGGTIVYQAGAPQNKWHAIRPDGTADVVLEDGGGNVAGPELTYDGAQMAYDDAASGGLVLVNTDGSGRLNVMPEYKRRMEIAASRGLSLSDDGTQVSFIYQYDTRPTKTALYVGYFDRIGAVPDAPVIKSISLSSPAAPKVDPAAIFTLKTEITDRQGDIEHFGTDHLLDGRLTYGLECPVFFRWIIHDDGKPPDMGAADGVLATEGTPGQPVDAFEKMTVRVGAKDAKGNVTVADALVVEQ